MSVVLLTAMGAAVTGLVTSTVDQFIEPNRVLDSARRDPAVRVSIDHRDGLVYATADRFVPGPSNGRYLDNLTPGFDELYVGNGGIRASAFSLTLGLEGRRNQTIRVAEIRPVITRRDVPLTDSLFLTYDAGGSDTERMTFNLDQPRPIARAINPDTGEPGDPFFTDRTITLSEGEVVTTVLDFAIDES